MGHREELLSAARRCLEDRGYARTTARDLVAASGTNLASIGYHFGSKEALLNQAIVDAFAEYTDKLLALASADADDDDPMSRIRRSWIVMVEEFEEMRPLLVAFIEAMAQAERTPELRAQLAEGYERLRSAIAESVADAVPGLPPDCARTMASFMIVVSDGLMVQWLLDPERTPSGVEVFETARLMFGH
jgi:AcrR family transcriptional regulator